MTYEEAVKKANEKLGDWKKEGNYYDGCYWFNEKSENTEALEVNNPRGLWANDGLVSISLFDAQNLEDDPRATKLESYFGDPFNITKEEAEIFRLEHGFDYPKELTNDL